jgi:hypothetical protein
LCFKAPLGGFGGKILEEKWIKGGEYLKGQGANGEKENELETGMI